MDGVVCNLEREGAKARVERVTTSRLVGGSTWRSAATFKAGPSHFANISPFTVTLTCSNSIHSQSGPLNTRHDATVFFESSLPTTTASLIYFNLPVHGLSHPTSLNDYTPDQRQLEESRH